MQNVLQVLLNGFVNFTVRNMILFFANAALCFVITKSIQLCKGSRHVGSLSSSVCKILFRDFLIILKFLEVDNLFDLTFVFDFPLNVSTAKNKTKNNTYHYYTIVQAT